MEVYHSSTSVVEHPDVRFSRPYLDFGPGFYITTLLDQAQKYGERFIRRGKKAVLNVYELDEDLSKWKVLRFFNYNDAWLDFVSECRIGKIIGDYDIIMGGIANDKVFRAVDIFFAGDINRDECLRRLLYEKPNNQICIRTQQTIIESLTYKYSRPL